MNYTRIFGIALGFLGFGADVVTVTSGTAGNAGNVAADLQTYFAANLLQVAELNTILDQFGERVTLPSNSSKTIQFTRMEKFATQTNPTQLTESLPPDAVGITMNQFDAVSEQYGFLVRLSDLAELTALKGRIISKYQGTPKGFPIVSISLGTNRKYQEIYGNPREDRGSFGTYRQSTTRNHFGLRRLDNDSEIRQFQRREFSSRLGSW